MWRHPKKTVFCRLSLLGELFFQNREFATEYFVFRRPCSLLATFRPKKEQRLLLYDRTVAATSPSPHTHPAPPQSYFWGENLATLSWKEEIFSKFGISVAFWRFFSWKKRLVRTYPSQKNPIKKFTLYIFRF